MLDSDLHAIRCARGAAERAAKILRRQLRRGTFGLEAIARIAVPLGIFGTGAGFIEAMWSYDPHGCDWGDCAGGLSEALIPIAISLPVAIVASGVLLRVRRQIDTLDLEMRAATLELLNYLVRPAHR